MLATLLPYGLGLIALICAAMAFRTWRDPDNWHLSDKTGRVTFHRWFDVGIFAAVGVVCVIVWLLGWGQHP